MDDSEVDLDGGDRRVHEPVVNHGRSELLRQLLQRQGEE